MLKKEGGIFHSPEDYQALKDGLTEGVQSVYGDDLTDEEAATIGGHLADETSGPEAFSLKRLNKKREEAEARGDLKEAARLEEKIREIIEIIEKRVREEADKDLEDWIEEVLPSDDSDPKYDWDGEGSPKP